METEAEFKQKYSSLTADQMLDAMYQMYLANCSLKERINSARRDRFGSKSEHVSVEQLSLFNEAEFVADHSSDEVSEPEQKPETKKTNQKKARKDHLKELPVKKRTDLYPESTEVDGHKMKEIAPEVIRISHYQRAEYYTEEIICHRFAYTFITEEGEEKTIIHEVPKEKKPKRMIKNSPASPELPAHFAYEKYILGLPFDRIAKHLSNNGIPLSKQYICQLVIHCGEKYLKAVIDRMTADLRQCHVVNMDETELEVLEWLQKEGRQACRIWGALTGPFEKKQMALFFYSKTREQSFLYEILGTQFHGIIQSDGYQAYTNYLPALMKVGCMSHARRKFFDAMTADKETYSAFKKAKQKGEREKILKQYPRFADTFKMVAKMDKLFDIERSLKAEQADPERIKEVRNEKARPIMEEIHEYNNYLKVTYLQTGKLGEAVTYLNNQWEYLMNYLKDGEAALSNNLAEREGMKPIVLARKNFLFADTERGATVSAYYFSILISAKLNHLDPEKYLAYLFRELTEHDLSPESIERVLPYSDQLPDTLRVR